MTTLDTAAAINPREAALSETAPFIPMDAVHVGKRYAQYFEPRGKRSGARAASGDVLFARITPCLENGKVAQVPLGITQCGGSTEFIVIRGSEIAIPDFLYFWATWDNTRAQAARLMTGTTGRQRLSADDLGGLVLLLPPIPTQKRIVDVLTSVDTYIAALQQQADDARTARNAVLHELLTAGGADWTETTLGQIAGLVMGKTPPRNEKKYWTDELAHPFCTIADMEGKWIHPKREGVTSTAIQNAKARKVAAGSLMMSFKLTIGRVGFAGVDLYPNEAIVAIDVDNRISTKEFLYLVLGSQDLTHGSGRAIKGATLNSASLAAIPLVLPPLSEQKRIVETVTAMDDVVSTTEQAVRVAQELRSGLLSTLLLGEHAIPEAYDRLFGAA